ncbi:MAG: response regulator receiver sensor signal transduction histidine kinase [Ignavibacteria bacterium]|nr:response regulator receiver sensor signal transduction histidine kinase [Ignavibacteria bacterium]
MKIFKNILEEPFKDKAHPDLAIRNNKKTKRTASKNKPTKKFAENKLVFFINSYDFPVIAFDSEGKISYFNDSYSNKFFSSNTKRSRFNQSISELPEFTETRLNDAVSKLISGTSFDMTEAAIKNQETGEISQFSIKGLSYKPNGIPDGGIIVLRDITDELARLEAGRYNQFFIRNMLEASPGPFFILSNDFLIQNVNTQAELATGEKRERLFGSQLMQYFTHEEKLMSAISKMYKSGEKQECELEIKHRNGFLSPVVLNISINYDNQGKAAGIFALALDASESRSIEEELKQYIVALRLTVRLTEERAEEIKKLNIQLSQSEAQLKELNAAKDKFFSIVAHDLKNPLSGFISFSEMLAKDIALLSKEDITDMLKEMSNSARSLFKLLENLLQWSRLQRGVMEFNPDNFNLHEITEMNIDVVRINASNKQISINNNVPQDIFTYCDVNMSNTIIRNLITNSIKFTNPGGNITIYAENFDERFIKICVKDTGVGMSQETIDKLFKIEFNLSSRGTADEIGTGLGLILCKDLVDKNGGNIWVESQPEQGSSFFFTLPINSAT